MISPKAVMAFAETMETIAERNSGQEASIKLINADNGRVITQLTHADLDRLAKIVAPDDLAGKLALFAAYLEGKNSVRGRRS